MSRPPWKRYTKLAVKGVIAVVVLGALGYHVRKTWNDLRRKGETVHADPSWLTAGGVLYLAGLTAFGTFYGRVMRSSTSPIATAPAIRAYLMSHLGKYVPGKAMVVVMRVGLSTPFGARPATAALATFYETLVMMAGGSFLAAVGFLIGSGTTQWLPVVLGLGLGTAFLVVVEPRVFPRIARVATSPFPAVNTDRVLGLDYGVMVSGLLWSALGWTLLGLSQVAVIRAVAPAGIGVGLWPLVVASVALATVAGFVVAVLPGGLGVREGFLMSTLSPAIGADTAMIAALALRLTWVAAEVLAASVLVFVRPIPTGDPAVKEPVPGSDAP